MRHGKDEESLPAVRSADLRRLKQCCRSFVAHAVKASDDLVSSKRQMMGDVLKKDDCRPDLPDDTFDGRPQVARIVFATLAAGDTERLAGVSGNDAIHASTPRCAIEGSEIRPHRRIIQSFVRDALRQDCAGIRFDLDIADCASSWHCQSDGEVESPCSGAEGQDLEGTWIHT